MTEEQLARVESRLREYRRHVFDIEHLGDAIAYLKKVAMSDWEERHSAAEERRQAWRWI